MISKHNGQPTGPKIILAIVNFYAKYKKVFGPILLLSSLILAWVFYGWKLAFIIFLALWGNNLEQSQFYGEKNKEEWRSSSRRTRGRF